MPARVNLTVCYPDQYVIGDEYRVVSKNPDHNSVQLVRVKAGHPAAGADDDADDDGPDTPEDTA